MGLSRAHIASLVYKEADFGRASDQPGEHGSVRGSADDLRREELHPCVR